MRDDHRRDLLVAQLLHVLGQPRDAVHVDVVGRLVEQQQLGLLEHRARARGASPAARERADGAVDDLSSKVHERIMSTCSLVLPISWMSGSLWMNSQQM